MNKILLSVVAMILGVGSLIGQSVSLVEEFTQASCPPCEQSTPMLNAILEANAEKVVQLRYQTSFPGVDPMNADNPEDVQVRQDYYSLQGVPTLYLNGIVPTGPTFPALITQSNIDVAYERDAPLTMTVTQELSEDFTKVSMVVTVTNPSTKITYDLPNDKLRVAGVEEKIVWPYRPGSTSITVFDAVMKKFYGGVAGMDVPALAPGESHVVEMTDMDLPNRMYNFNEYATVAFIQNDQNKNVVAAAYRAPEEVEGLSDISVSSNDEASGELCEVEYSGTAMVTNSGTSDIEGYSVIMAINGDEVARVDETGVLAAGTSADVTFDAINLPAGTSNLTFNAIVASGVDGVFLNNQTLPLTFLKAGEPVDELEKDFESDAVGGIPQGAAIDNPFSGLNFAVVNQDFLQANNRLGAYGESDNSVLVNFYGWNPANFAQDGSMIIADQYTIPASGATFSFDHAYTSFQGSNDELRIELSTDCGDSFTELWSAAGSELRTAPEVNSNNSFFTPGSNDWASDTISLNDYIGETVLIRFGATTAWGDMLYLDNGVINALMTNVSEISPTASVEITPNPATSFVNVGLNVTNNENVSIQITDLVGGVVLEQDLGIINGESTVSYDVSSFASGVYIFKILAGTEFTSQKVSVIK